MADVSIIEQWVGYCGGTTQEKRNGVSLEVEHDEIWAICYTSEGHVITRYGSARSKPVRKTTKPFRPFVVSPEQPIPLKELTDRLDSQEKAEKLYRERIEAKTSPRRKGHQFREIPFGQPPYYILSFARYLNATREGKG